MAKTEEKPVVLETVYVSESESDRPIYVNNVNISITPHEVRMVLSEILEIDGAVLKAALRANVVMSHSHARSLAVAMQQTVEAINKQEQAASKLKKEIGDHS